MGPQSENDWLEYFCMRYLSKQEIKYRLPSGYRLNPFWEQLLDLRMKKGRKLPLLGQDGNPFWYNLTPKTLENIELITLVSKERIERLIDQSIKREIVHDTMIDEAFYSSVIEGAVTTRARTEEMVKKKAPPRNKSEQMVINGYRTLDYILSHLESDIDEKVILHIHKLITDNTLEPDEVSEKYRDGDAFVVNDQTDEVIYKAPDHTRVQGMMDQLIAFIRNDRKDEYIPPLVKAAIIHFYFVYIHPFFDGNGRTARAISYMYLLQNGYGFFKLFSVSSVIEQRRGKYYKSIKAVEDDASDVTYFIEQSLEMTSDAIEQKLKDIGKRYDKKIIWDYLAKQNIQLNKRQESLTRYMLQKDGNIIMIADYQNRNNISYETARRDLKELVALGLFEEMKGKRQYVYRFTGGDGILRKQGF